MLTHTGPPEAEEQTQHKNLITRDRCGRLGGRPRVSERSAVRGAGFGALQAAGREKSPCSCRPHSKEGGDVKVCLRGKACARQAASNCPRPTSPLYWLACEATNVQSNCTGIGGSEERLRQGLALPYTQNGGQDRDTLLPSRHVGDRGGRNDQTLERSYKDARFPCETCSADGR